jgi:hypothetical protein
VASALANLGLGVALRDELVSRVGAVLAPGLRASGRALTDAELARQAEVYVYAGLALAAVLAVIIAALAVATLRGPGRLLAWVDLGLLAAGALAPLGLMGPMPLTVTQPPPAPALAVGAAVSLLDVGLLLVAVPGLARPGRRS